MCQATAVAMRDSSPQELRRQQQLKPGLCCRGQVNGVIEGTDIIYRDYCDISIAVATPKGLVVPVLRDADKLDFAGVERVRSHLHPVLWSFPELENCRVSHTGCWT